jgi:hypothetical protein
MFTILGFEPGPAVFKVTDLVVSPQNVETGESVTISVSVANTGGKEGTYNVILMVNNTKETEESVIIAAGSTRQVTFSVLKEDTGSYIVSVDGLSISFEVTARPVPSEPPETPEVPEISPEPTAPIAPVTPPPTPEPVEPTPLPTTSFNWWLTAGIITGVIVIGMLIWKLRYFFRRGD